MTLTELVPSREVCQRLKQAGFPQDTALVWANSPQGWISGGGWRVDNGVVATIPFLPSDGYVNVVMAVGAVNTLHTILCAAPTAEEILRVLPVLIRIREDFAGLRSWVSTSNDFSFYVGWQAYHIPSEKEDPWYGADKFSEAAALAYLWWKEQK
jgi:hypothetical protein